MGCGGSCGCGGVQRKYYTKDEQLEWLKEYEKTLECELKGVKEKLAWLEKMK